MSAASILLKGKQVPVVCKYALMESHLSKILSFRPFINWQKQIQALKISVEQVEIQDVDYFGTRVGFLKFKAVCKYEDGTTLPGIVFSRGESVAILVVVQTPSTKYVVLVEQIRIAVGKPVLELPAGMMDDNDSITGVAVQELQEECGITLKHENLIEMARLSPSPGACDEFITIFKTTIDMSDEDALSLHGKLSGLRDHGERIQLNLVSFDDLYNSESMTVLAALALYNKSK